MLHARELFIRASLTLGLTALPLTGCPPTDCEPEDAAACDVDASCAIEDGAPVCTCDAGFEGDGFTCASLDVCAEGLHDCDPLTEQCVAELDGYRCACQDGYSDQGEGCEVDPALYVADLSDHPVALSVEGIGDFQASGMGRLATEMLYVSRDGTNGRVYRLPTETVHHELVLRGLSAEVEGGLDALLDWAASGETRAVSIVLEGLPPEQLELALTESLLRVEDEAVVDGRLAEVVVSPGGVTLSNYHPPRPVGSPPEGTLVEVEGIGNFAFPAEDITLAADGTADSLELRSVAYDGQSAASALIDWQLWNAYALERTGEFARNSLSQIALDAQGAELGRVNCYETFPSLVTWFNPTKSYGSTFLVDVVIATEICEDVR
ncbi:MAG: hypothetical protein H6740_26770 [Alphaproteobacteria bacterium]|nr:hypothetical protein [Alphaproteobacteria bacterium]